MAKASVRSNVTVQLFLVIPFMSRGFMFGLYFFGIVLAGEGKAGCYNLIVVLLPCGCLYSVLLSRSAMGWSVIGNSWSYSLPFWCHV